MKKIYLLLGSNLGEPAKQFKKAKSHLQKQIGKIIRESSCYSTAAWGNTNQPDFLNQVIILESTLSPQKVMQKILSIEKEMGRIRTKKNAPRIIDIDILFYGKTILTTENLTIPHPLLQERNFVLVPLNELSPNFKHPIIKKSVHQLMLKCKDRLAVKKNS